jgi:hypothetical protein
MNEHDLIDYNDISWIECSVMRYRQGEITVRLDFDRNLLTWKDSNRWFNDFVRSITPEQARKIKDRLHKLLGYVELTKTFKYDPDDSFIWQIKLGERDSDTPSWEVGGTRNDLAAWIEFVKVIEEASEQTIDPLGGH